MSIDGGQGDIMNIGPEGGPSAEEMGIEPEEMKTDENREGGRLSEQEREYYNPKIKQMWEQGRVDTAQSAELKAIPKPYEGSKEQADGIHISVFINQEWRKVEERLGEMGVEGYAGREVA